LVFPLLGADRRVKRLGVVVVVVDELLPRRLYGHVLCLFAVGIAEAVIIYDLVGLTSRREGRIDGRGVGRPAGKRRSSSNHGVDGIDRVLQRWHHKRRGRVDGRGGDGREVSSGVQSGFGL
jgi:hypothetical protein